MEKETLVKQIEKLQDEINQITSELKTCEDDRLYQRLWDKRVDLKWEQSDLVKELESKENEQA